MASAVVREYGLSADMSGTPSFMVKTGETMMTGWDAPCTASWSIYVSAAAAVAATFLDAVLIPDLVLLVAVEP